MQRFGTRWLRADRPFGRGGQADVYRASAIGGSDQYVVKILRSRNPKAEARIRREIEVLGQLVSDHVVRVVEHGVADFGNGSVPFFVSPYLGRDMQWQFHRYGWPSLRRALDLFEQIVL